MNRLTIALIASALSATAAACPWNPLDALESPAAKAKQQMVQETAVYPQEGATSGIAANEMMLQRDTPPVLATMQEKQDAVAASAVYPQEGATSGEQAVKLREQRDMPHPLATMRDMQEAVDSVTKANAGS